MSLRFWQQRIKWIDPLFLLVGMLLLQPWVNQLAYLRSVLWQEPWRLWTAHWVHVGWVHLALNAAAILLLPYVIAPLKRWQFWSGLWVLSGSLSAALYWCDPVLSAYVGLSGVLHGLYVMAAVLALCDRHERGFAILILVVIVLKLWLESWIGQGGTAQLIGAPVVFAAHELGVLLASVWILLFITIKKVFFQGGLTKNATDFSRQ
jgi:rhomboid family GlyGly-CTERM serine protease